MNLLEILSTEEITTYTKETTLRSGEVLFNEGDICNYIGIIKSGAINITTYTNEDKPEIIASLRENMMFGENLIFQDNNKYLGTIEAIKKTTVCLISKTSLLILLKTNKIFLEHFLKEITTLSFNYKQQIKLLSHKNIKDRIMFYFNLHKTNNILTIKSVKALADELSLPRPSVSRELTKLENEHLIVKHHHTITIL